MSAKQLDIAIEQGADYQNLFYVVDSSGNPVNITGAIVAMQIRTEIGSPSALVTLTTQDRSIEINGTQGTIALSGLNEVITTALSAGVYVYDIKMLDTTGKTTRLFQGTAAVSPEVTTIILSPGSGDVLLEGGGEMLQEDGSKILTES